MGRLATAWQSTCLVCHASITNHGSGRAKTLCSVECKKTRQREISRLRYQNVIRPAQLLKRKKIPARAPSKQSQDIARQRNMMAAEKLKRGKCAYHLHYFGSDLYVTQDLMHIFEFDHIDPNAKHQPNKKRGGGVARMIGRVNDIDLIAEMQKCELVCCNCHRLKTIENRDWSVKRNEVQEVQLQIQLQ
jgi:hypothetical protein